MTSSTRLVTMLLWAVLAANAAQAAGSPDVIRFSPASAGGYPEGIAWDAASRTFFVSSLRTGQVGRVSVDGRFRAFSDHPGLVTTSGIVVDSVRRSLLVCNEDVGVGRRTSAATKTRLAQVVEFNLDTGAVRRVYDLSALSDGPMLPNDLVMAPNGDLFVTDSFQPAVYKIDRTSGVVSVFLRSDRLMPPKEEGGAASGERPHLNGIVYHADGYLLVSDYARGLLWRVPIGQPKSFSQVKLPDRLKGPDGLLLRNANELVAVQSFPGPGGTLAGDVSLLRSDDGWQSARIVSVSTPKRLDGPTTATLKDGEVWVVNSRYPRLFADPARADRTRNFELTKVAFPTEVR